MIRILLPLLFLLGALAAQAANIKISINSGTGFFVSRDGYLLTNVHVINQCKRIVVVGAVRPQLATIIGRDTKHDLALLKIDTSGVETAAFREEQVPVTKGERVVVVGYPGEAWRKAQTVTRDAEVISDRGPRGEDKWIQFSDKIEQGNSGGPLFDSYGNVIGVIVARAVIYTYEKSAPEHGTYNNAGVAISTPVVKKFLDSHRVRYRLADAQSSLSNDRMTDYAHNFVVNVRCETPTEIR